MTNKIYSNKNSPPPLEPAMYGNFHKFQSPIADPAAAITNPKEEEKLPRLFIDSFDI